MADFADLKPIITNTKKKGSHRTTRSSLSSKISTEPVTIPEIPETVQVKGYDSKGKLIPTYEKPKPNVFTIDDQLFTLTHWKMFFGYIFLRLVAPVVLLVHCVIVMYAFYVHMTKTGVNGVQAFEILIPIFLHFLMSKYLTKFLFRKTIYMIHPDYPLYKQIVRV